MFWKKQYVVIILIILLINYLLLYLMRHPKFEPEKSGIIEPEVVEKVEHSPPQPTKIHMKTDDGDQGVLTEKSLVPDFQIAVLVMACNRSSITRCIDSILRARKNDSRFPVIVSQDCDHMETERYIKSYRDVLYMKQPNQTDPILEKKKAKLKGYFRIARHYRWALNQVFFKLKHTACIVIEDDLEVSPDIFEYFLATYPILVKDSHLYCVSAWNDNGKTALIDSSKPGLIHRTDFFPGLGWMLLKKLWLEFEPIWPDGFWDDWMRTPAIRKDRSCLRPEISRTETFGRKGVSNGMHYVAHLQYIKKYESFYPFTKENLSYVELDNYEEPFLRKAYLSHEVDKDSVLGKKLNINLKESLRVTYRSKEDFKEKAKLFGIMFDFKSGIPRTAYRGIVPFMHLNRLIYLCPIYDWSGYNASWN